MAYSAGNGAAARTNTQVEARTGGSGWWNANALLATPTDWWTRVLNV